ncbi:hypothetical protein OS122_03750 [Mycolicibacterium mucogenicum]|nr:hypothetical protein [Mycolicibacterium mucogenicum]MCX8560014.1 hypothetical protein [Mycolicibacterium mucogenicum]
MITDDAPLRYQSFILWTENRHLAVKPHTAGGRPHQPPALR